MLGDRETRLGAGEDRLREFAADAWALFFGPGALSGDAREGLNDAPGNVFGVPRAIFEPAAADFAAGQLLSDVGVRCFSPAAEIVHVNR
jgi:hypothetical protein